MKRKPILIFVSVLFMAACGQEFLDVKPGVRQRTPSSWEDYLGLLDNTSNMNSSSHALGMIGADEYFITQDRYETFPSGVFHNYQKRAYTWEERIFEGNETYFLDWNGGYSNILWANLVLDGVKSLPVAEGERELADMVKGTALFHRAWNFYCLAQLFCPVYGQGDANTQLGLPLRLEADVTVNVKRSTLEATYQRIIRDLEEADPLLPEVSSIQFRPGKAAVYALLAKTYLQMGDYRLAYDYADRCLDLKRELLDYNRIDLMLPAPFSPNGQDNPEIVFFAICPGNTTFRLLLTSHYMQPDTNLLKLYGPDDLRSRAFFEKTATGEFQYKGSYDGSGIYNYFTGLAIDEMYLIRAECAARLGMVEEALNDLNFLRKHRVEADGYTLLSHNDPKIILSWILAERRRELVLRGTRWEDLRRLNKEAEFATTLVRRLGETEVRLEPGSVRYVWPLPVEAVSLGGYEQNVR